MRHFCGYSEIDYTNIHAIVPEKTSRGIASKKFIFCAFSEHSGACTLLQ